MAPTPTSSVWLTDNLPTATNRAYNKQRSNLFDAAENGNWTQLFAILQDAQKTYKESWVNCPTSADGWTPLHYAAYEGTSVNTVNKLLEMGAWRSIRTVATTGTPLSESEMTPLEVAHEGEHSSLYMALKPIFKLNVRDAILEELEDQFHELIEGEMGWAKDSCRLPRLGVLKEGTGTGWFPVRPGGSQEGYLYRLDKNSLLVWGFDGNGALEAQRRVTEKEVRDVVRGDPGYDANPRAVGNASKAGKDATKAGKDAGKAIAKAGPAKGGVIGAESVTTSASRSTTTNKATSAKAAVSSTVSTARPVYKSARASKNTVVVDTIERTRKTVAVDASSDSGSDNAIDHDSDGGSDNGVDNGSNNDSDNDSDNASDSGSNNGSDNSSDNGSDNDSDNDSDNGSDNGNGRLVMTNEVVNQSNCNDMITITKLKTRRWKSNHLTVLMRMTFPGGPWA